MATKASDNWKSKVWFNVYPPKLLGESTIGEIPANDEKGVMGRVIKVSMSWITHRAEHSFMLVGLRVKSVSGNNINTEIDYIEQTYSYIHSLVKRHSSAIYTMDRLADKNGRKYVLKLLAVTGSKIRTPKKMAVRKKLEEFVREFSASHTVDDLLNSMLNNSFQSEAVRSVNNIARISKLELKRIEF
ncbi:MAG: eS1 family ribosomal protein [Candidatus Micrarchaeaceae archaeon]